MCAQTLPSTYRPNPHPARAQVNHSVVVHLDKAKSRFYEKAKDALDAAVARGTTPLAQARLRCHPARWLHTASRHWQECQNAAACDTWNGKDPTKLQVTPAAGWLPVGVRTLCKDEARSVRRARR